MLAATLNTVFSEKITLNEGDAAPQFTLENQDGVFEELTDYLGQRVVVYFFPMADTPGWIKEACGFRNIYSEFEKNNISVVGISYDKPESLRNFKDKFNLPFSFLSDRNKTVARSYGANGIFMPKRMTFVISSQGKIEKIYKKVNINTHAENILKDLIY